MPQGTVACCNILPQGNVAFNAVMPQGQVEDVSCQAAMSCIVAYYCASRYCFVEFRLVLPQGPVVYRSAKPTDYLQHQTSRR